MSSILNKLLLSIIILLSAYTVFDHCKALTFSDNNYAIIKDKKIYLTIADTPSKRQKGLMFVKKLPENNGMLFLFDKPEIKKFWMKNMVIPIDIIFMKNSKIVKIYHNVQPDNKSEIRLYSSIREADSALELNAGLSAKYNIKEGDTINLFVRHSNN